MGRNLVEKAKRIRHERRHFDDVDRGRESKMLISVLKAIILIIALILGFRYVMII